MEWRRTSTATSWTMPRQRK